MLCLEKEIITSRTYTTKISQKKFVGKVGIVVKKIILESLKQIENKHEVKILFACESGSRAWGYSNKNSDYDVRFIYIHRPSWYLSIDPQRDFIELPVSKSLDVNGWELQKCLKLYRKSNPTILEWIHSNLHYTQPYSTVEKLRHHTQDVFSPIACLYHFIHMAQKNFRKEQNESINVKNYFNILRPILAAKWIENYGQFPPVEFTKLVEKMMPIGDLKQEINCLLASKINGEFSVTKNTLINDFIQNEIKRLTEYVKNIEVENENPTPLLNTIFLDCMKEVWKIKI
jgi:uncharacterized protein